MNGEFELDEPIVSFDTAKLAQDKGFPQIRLGDINSHYNEFGNLNGTVLHAKDYIREMQLKGKQIFMKSYIAPTLSMMERWLREVHNIRVSLSYKPNIKKWDFYQFNMDTNGTDYVRDFKNIEKRKRSFDTHEQALEAGIVEALNQIVYVKRV